MKFTSRRVCFLLQIVLLGFAGVHGAAFAATAASTGSESLEKRVFSITAATKDKTHPFFGKGHKIGLTLDGVQGKSLVLTRGVEYTFNIDTGPQHDFYFSTSAVGQGGSTVTDGVEGQFTFRGTVTFTPSAVTPDVVYYQCRNHRSMGGMLKIVDKGKTSTLDDAAPVMPGAAIEGHPETDHPPVAEVQIKQKIEYANMLVNSSKGAQRVAASSNAQAKEMLASARTHLDSARATLGASDLVKAQDEVDESIRLITAAVRLVPSDADQSGLDPKFRYTELLDATKTFESSYKQHSERLTGKKKPAAAALDEKKFQDLMSQAKVHGDAERYEEANKALSGAQRMVTRALGALLDNETVVYDKSFATPAAEYEYEVARYKSYEDLIPLALEQKKPSAMTVDKIAELEQKSKALNAEAEQLAGKNDHAAAIGALQEATSYLQRALMIAGVN